MTPDIDNPVCTSCMYRKKKICMEDMKDCTHFADNIKWLYKMKALIVIILITSLSLGCICDTERWVVDDPVPTTTTVKLSTTTNALKTTTTTKHIKTSTTSTTLNILNMTKEQAYNLTCETCIEKSVIYDETIKELINRCRQETVYIDKMIYNLSDVQTDCLLNLKPDKCHTAACSDGHWKAKKKALECVNLVPSRFKESWSTGYSPIIGNTEFNQRICTSTDPLSEEEVFKLNASIWWVVKNETEIIIRKI